MKSLEVANFPRKKHWRRKERIAHVQTPAILLKGREHRSLRTSPSSQPQCAALRCSVTHACSALKDAARQRVEVELRAIKRPRISQPALSLVRTRHPRSSEQTIHSSSIPSPEKSSISVLHSARSSWIIKLENNDAFARRRCRIMTLSSSGTSHLPSPWERDLP